jgi:DNA end-binding protein Ku
MPASVWTGNLRLSLVIIPVRLYPASSDQGVAFRMIHEKSGEPIQYRKGIETEHGFEEVPDEEIVKGYEYAKGQYVLLEPEDLDKLKLEAKHTIELARFVDLADVDSRYFEKPYYIAPDGDEAMEGFVVIRDALKSAKKMAIGQLIMSGREHIVGIKAHGKGMLLERLRYAYQLRDAKDYFEHLRNEANPQAVAMAKELIGSEEGPFEPKKMPDAYVEAVQELVRAKLEHRAPHVELETKKSESPKVINIMERLKESMQAKGRGKLHEAATGRTGKTKKVQEHHAKRSGSRSSPRRTAH